MLNFCPCIYSTLSTLGSCLKYYNGIGDIFRKILEEKFDGQNCMANPYPKGMHIDVKQQ